MVLHRDAVQNGPRLGTYRYQVSDTVLNRYLRHQPVRQEVLVLLCCSLHSVFERIPNQPCRDSPQFASPDFHHNHGLRSARSERTMNSATHLGLENSHDLPDHFALPNYPYFGAGGNGEETAAAERVCPAASRGLLFQLFRLVKGAVVCDYTSRS